MTFFESLNVLEKEIADEYYRPIILKKIAATLPAEIQKQYIHNVVDQDHCAVLFDILRYDTEPHRFIIIRAFTWDETAEGHDYWHEVHNKLCKGIIMLNIPTIPLITRKVHL